EVPVSRRRVRPHQQHVDAAEPGRLAHRQGAALLRAHRGSRGGPPHRPLEPSRPVRRAAEENDGARVDDRGQPPRSRHGREGAAPPADGPESGSPVGRGARVHDQRRARRESGRGVSRVHRPARTPAHLVTPERFRQGRTFEEYLEWIGTPDNLAREAGSWLGAERMDFSAIPRAYHARRRLSDAQIGAIRWLVAQPNGPRKVLVISEEWSSDCRRDVPMVARLADAGGLELRIFTRDGTTLGRGPKADPATSPNADIVNEFLNAKDGETFQSVPVVVFYAEQFEVLYRYVEFPAIYHKERLYTAMQRQKPGETTKEQTWERFLTDWKSLQVDTTFFPLWGGAAIDEMLSALHERLLCGAVA